MREICMTACVLLVILYFGFKFLLQTKPELKKADSIKKALEDELTCTICLEQVNRGELVRS